MATRGRSMVLLLVASCSLIFGIVAYADNVNLTTFLRTRDVNRLIGVEGREHLLEDENVNIDDTFLANHHFQSGGGSFGDNMAFADFWYDAAHRRVHTRSLDLKELDDPVDVRIVRVPAFDHNTPRHDIFHGHGTVFGFFGFSQWRLNNNGAGAYFGALQGRIINDASNGNTNSTGWLELATASGTNIDEPQYGGNEIQPRLQVSPDGTVTIGPPKHDDPNFIHRARLVVNSRNATDIAVDVTRGLVRSANGFCIGGDCRSAWPSGGGGALSCENRTVVGTATNLVAQCLAGETVTGGGGSCGATNGALRSSRKFGSAGWEITCSAVGDNRAEAECCRIQ